jgi:hypothetical protein
MTYLVYTGIAFVFLIIAVTSLTKKSREQRNRIDSAKLRSETRSSGADVWALAVPISTAIHTADPIEFDTTVHYDDSMTESQYQTISAIFDKSYHKTLANDYWADTEKQGL